MDVLPGRATRVLGLDSLRAIAAIWVVISHIGFAPMLDGWDRSTIPGFLVHAGSGILFSGPAAVVVFFLISGFCIHFPYISHAPFRIVPFLARRYIRVGIPMGVAIWIASAAGVHASSFFDAVLWSLVAELIYYTIYPAIRSLLRVCTLNSVVAGSYLASLAVYFLGSGAPGYAIYGWTLNWLLGLPCWLLGLKLAQLWVEQSGRIVSPVGDSEIWRWRLLAWSTSSICVALNFHSPLPFALTLNVFSAIAYGWLIREMRRANFHKQPWAVLEWAGGWSYAVYLCHPMAAAIFFASCTGPYSVPVAVWIAKLVFILLASFVFYRCVELPAHGIARRAALIS